MPENTAMGERIYEHYLRYGQTKKKLKRKTFMKRYGYKLKRRLSPGTRRIKQGIGDNMTERDFQKFGPK